MARSFVAFPLEEATVPTERLLHRLARLLFKLFANENHWVVGQRRVGDYDAHLQFIRFE